MVELTENVVVTDEANAELGPLLRAGAVRAWRALLAHLTTEQRTALDGGEQTVWVWPEVAGAPRYGFRREGVEVIASVAVDSPDRASGVVEVALGYLEPDRSGAMTELANKVSAELTRDLATMHNGI